LLAAATSAAPQADPPYCCRFNLERAAAHRSRSADASPRAPPGRHGRAGNSRFGSTTRRCWAARTYLRGQLDGADFIVGPLLRGGRSGHRASGLRANARAQYAQAEAPASRSFYQFALSSDDEARAAADSAADAGARRRSPFVPNDPRGYRLKDTFAPSSKPRGGALVNFASFEPGAQGRRSDHQSDHRLFNITKSTRQRGSRRTRRADRVEARRRQTSTRSSFTSARTDARTARLLAPATAPATERATSRSLLRRTSSAGHRGTRQRLERSLLLRRAVDRRAGRAHRVDAPRFADVLAAARDAKASQLRLYSNGVDGLSLAGSLYGARGVAHPGMSGNLSLDDSDESTAAFLLRSSATAGRAVDARPRARAAQPAHRNR